ncbi:MAG: HAD family hydrolase [Bacilli bacterium]|nr:HAD family hydrolase [Bacilli bacterium]
MLKAVFFDLDGTLLPLNEEEFTKIYFGLLSKRMIPLGYEPEELISVIWAGTKAMYKNDGTKTNEEVFWDAFKNHYGIEKMKDKAYIDGFYTNEFKKTKESCEDNPLAKTIVSFCKDNNLLVVLSTNPIFPKVGTMTRMSYIGLKEEDFDYVTYYENSNYCKLNPMYFKELLNKFNLKPEEVIVFGNNTYEDGKCAKLCGIECFMVGDYVINSPKTRNQFEHILMGKVIDKIKEYL